MPRPAPVLVLAAGLILSATQALAGALIVTPPLKPPSGGQLRCAIANASDTVIAQIEWALYNFDGDLVFGPATATLGPHEHVRNDVPPAVTVAASCAVRALAGGKGNLRVSLYAEDSSGNIVAAVNGN
jgi:hypothetical protein